MFPSTQDYKIALMIGADSFRTLQDVKVVMNPNYPTEPWFSTGGLAIVFKILVGGKPHALKCFYKDAPERQERLGYVATYLRNNPSDYFVTFQYLQNELWVETNGHGQGYDVVLMEWVAGTTLDNYLEHTCRTNQTTELQTLYYRFCSLAWWLHQEPFAHGDLKHDNIIVTPEGKLKLIDYDGMYVPTLHGRKATEQGSPCYQHPQRNATHFDEQLDDFSLLVLQITLLALWKQPALFAEHYNGDGILLKYTDYQHFDQAHIRQIIWQIPESKLPLLLGQLRTVLKQQKPTSDLLALINDHDWINWLVQESIADKQRIRHLQLKLKWWVLRACLN